MSKSIELGKKLDDLISVSPMKPEDKHYPDLYLYDVEDPALYEMPDKGECTIRYQVVSRTHREEKDGKNGKKKRSCSLRLEVTSIKPPQKATKQKGYGDDLRKSFTENFK